MKSWSKFIVFVIAGLLIGAILMFNSGLRDRSKEDDYQLAEDAIDGEYVRPTRSPGQSTAQKELSYFTIQVNATPTVSRGSGRCNLMVGNPAENEQYVKVKLILDETGEELFYSELLEPGDRNAYVNLEQIPAKAGEHKATAVFMVYDQDNMEPITEIDAGVLLTVE